mmetsp:Transcript_258/g.518  ORF Transcript_258/g.518 Transcript_258/m.518 type:complete len:229 (-) Transcript_258:359-1045(-)
MKVVLDDVWVLVVDDYTTNRRDQINGGFDGASGLHSRFKMDARREFLEDIESRSSLHDTFSVVYQNYLDTPADERAGNVWVQREFFGVQKCIGGRFHLRVISGGQSPSQWLPSTITSICSAIHFYQARTRFRDNNFSVTRTVFHPEHIQSFSDVGNDQFGFFRVGFDRDATKIDECAAVSFTLVIYPHHHGLVNTVETDMIDDVFFSLEKFLAKYLPAITPVDQLTAH